MLRKFVSIIAHNISDCFLPKLLCALGCLGCTEKVEYSGRRKIPNLHQEKKKSKGEKCRL